VMPLGQLEIKVESSAGVTDRSNSRRLLMGERPSFQIQDTKQEYILLL
jgi:hypothetical protein